MKIKSLAILLALPVLAFGQIEVNPPGVSPANSNLTGSTTVENLTVSGSTTANGNTTLGDASGDTLTINAGTVSTPNSYFRRNKAGACEVAAKMSTYSNTALTVVSVYTGQVVQFADGITSASLEIRLNPAEWAGKSVKISAVILSNGTSGGNVRLRMLGGYLTAAALNGANNSGSLLTSGGNSTGALGDGVSSVTTGSDFAAPTTAANPLLVESGAFTISSSAQQIYLSFSAIRSNAGDTNTDNLYIQEIRVTEQ